MELFLVIAWAILGIANLCGNKVSKVSYAATWSVLMLYLIKNLIGA
jgi:hypothetical protein